MSPKTPSELARERYAASERAAGRPMRVPCGPAREHRDRLRAAGMTDSAIAAEATRLGFPMHQTTVTTMGQRANIHRDTQAGILSIDPDFVEASPHKLISSIGAQRAIGAMMVRGYSLNWLSAHAIYDSGDTTASYGHHTYAHNILAGKKCEQVELQTFQRIWRIANKLEMSDPLDMGMNKQAASRARAYAAKHGFVPLSCWDEDTVNDPDAFPEWTGECGTVRGYYLHLKHDVQVRKYREGSATAPGKQRREVLCAACRAARSTVARGGSVGTWVDEDGIREAVADGEVYRQIAERFECSTMTVQRVVNRMKEEGFEALPPGVRPKGNREE